MLFFKSKEEKELELFTFKASELDSLVEELMFYKRKYYLELVQEKINEIYNLDIPQESRDKMMSIIIIIDVISYLTYWLEYYEPLARRFDRTQEEDSQYIAAIDEMYKYVVDINPNFATEDGVYSYRTMVAMLEKAQEIRVDLVYQNWLFVFNNIIDSKKTEKDIQEWLFSITNNIQASLLSANNEVGYITGESDEEKQYSLFKGLDHLKIALSTQKALLNVMINNEKVNYFNVSLFFKEYQSKITSYLELDADFCEYIYLLGSYDRKIVKLAEDNVFDSEEERKAFAEDLIYEFDVKARKIADKFLHLEFPEMTLDEFLLKYGFSEKDEVFPGNWKDIFSDIEPSIKEKLDGYCTDSIEALNTFEECNDSIKDKQIN